MPVTDVSQKFVLHKIKSKNCSFSMRILIRLFSIAINPDNVIFKRGNIHDKFRFYQR